MPTAVARAAEGFPARWRWQLVELDESVADTWRAHATPTWIDDDLVVVPAWLPFDAPTGHDRRAHRAGRHVRPRRPPDARC